MGQGRWREVGDVEPIAFALAIDLDAEEGTQPFEHECHHGGGRTDGLVVFPEVLFDFLGLDGMLGKNGARAGRALGGTVVFVRDLDFDFPGFIKLLEQELGLAVATAAGGDLAIRVDPPR